MSPTPEPRPGLYLDSCQTRYQATHDKRTGWWIHKIGGPQPPYQKPDFQDAVLAKIFTFQSDTI